MSPYPAPVQRIADADALARSARTASTLPLEPEVIDRIAREVSQFKANLDASAVDGVPIPWEARHGVVPGSYKPPEPIPGTDHQFTDATIDVRVPCEATWVDITSNDLVVTGLALAMLPAALVVRLVASMLPGVAELTRHLPDTVFGTGDRSGLAGGIFGNNSPVAESADRPIPGALGIAMGMANAGPGLLLGDFKAGEVGGLGHDTKTGGTSHSDALTSALHTLGQGLGVLCHHLNLVEPIDALLGGSPVDPASAPAQKAEYGLLAGFRQGSRQRTADVTYRLTIPGVRPP